MLCRTFPQSTNPEFNPSWHGIASSEAPLCIDGQQIHASARMDSAGQAGLHKTVRVEFCQSAIEKYTLTRIVAPVSPCTVAVSARNKRGEKTLSCRNYPRRLGLPSRKPPVSSGLPIRMLRDNTISGSSTDEAAVYCLWTLREHRRHAKEYPQRSVIHGVCFDQQVAV